MGLVDGTIINPQSSRVTRNIILRNFEKRFETLMWTGITKGEATGGIEEGTPCLATAKRCHTRMIRQGKMQQANCLEAVVAHTIWNEVSCGRWLGHGGSQQQ